MNNFLNELAKYMADNGIGVWTADAGRNIFVGVVPPDTDDLVALLGLPGPTLGVARDVPSLQFPRFQVFVRNKDYDTGADKLQAVRTLLHGKIGLILPHWRVLRMHVDQEGGPIGDDEQGRYEFTVNFTVEHNAETSV